MDEQDPTPMTSVDVTEEVGVDAWERPRRIRLHVVGDDGLASVDLTPDQARAVAAALTDAANNLEAGDIATA